MTLAELKAISDGCKTGAAFMAHAEVRRIWWGDSVKPEEWRHNPTMESGNYVNGEWHSTMFCRKCGKRWNEQENLVCHNEPCPVPDPIPGSLADAVEMLRMKVAQEYDSLDQVARAIVHALVPTSDEDWCDRYISDGLRERFLVFAAALGAIDSPCAQEVA